jgi:hypothetical protein
MTNYLILDLETLKSELAETRADAWAFKPDSRIKDPEKIEANIADQRTKLVRDAALNAGVATIAMVNMKVHGEYTLLTIEEMKHGERQLLDEAWSILEDAVASGLKIIGFNTSAFDLPLMIRRSWDLEVPVPTNIQHSSNGREYLNSQFVDLKVKWACGVYGENISLHNLAVSLGLDAKSGDGADFGRLWAEDRPAAIAYAIQDLEVTEACALRMIRGLRQTEPVEAVAP